MERRVLRDVLPENATRVELLPLVTRAALGKAAASAAEVHHVLLVQSIATAGLIAEKTGLTPATVNKSLAHLDRLGIVRELTQQRRNRIFSYSRHIDIINQGTDLPGSCA